MKVSAALILLASTANAFAPAPMCSIRSHQHQSALVLSETAMAEAGVPPAHADENANVDDAEIPTNLPSDVGFDYVPLATMLATGQLAEADQVRYYTWKRYTNSLFCC